MMNGAKLGALLVAALVGVVAATPLSPVHGESPGQWQATTKYPISVAGDSCVAVSSTVYCVGGFDSNGNSQSDVYYAALSSSGVGTWSKGLPYPTPIDSASCVNATSGVYCVGGEDGTTVLNDVYYAPFASSGLGAWTSETPYPSDDAAPSCVVYSGYIYCVGGFDANGDEVSSTFYASVSSGLGSWTGTSQYPLAVDSESCAVYSGDIYCVAGETESGSNQNVPITDVYYAPLNSSGIGQWTAALSYPTALAALSCAEYGGYLYCVGGFDASQLSNTNAYFGQASSTGVASWTDMTQYPVPVDTSSCVAAIGYLYCVGGTSVNQSGQSMVSTTYYAPISVSTTTTSTTPEFPVGVAIPGILALGLLAVGGLSRAGRRRA